MKTTFLTLAVAALMLAACGRKTEPAVPDPEPAPAMEPAPPTTAVAPKATDSISAGDTGVMQPTDPPPTLPPDPSGVNPSTGSPPPQP